MVELHGGLVAYERYPSPTAVDRGNGTEYVWWRAYLKDAPPHSGFGQTPEEAYSDLLASSGYARELLYPAKDGEATKSVTHIKRPSPPRQKFDNAFDATLCGKSDPGLFEYTTLGRDEQIPSDDNICIQCAERHIKEH